MTDKLRKISIVIASRGRPAVLAQWQTIISNQTIKPHLLVYSVTEKEDLPPENLIWQPSIVVVGSSGLAHQRNRGLDVIINDSDIVAFFDDDYVPAPDCIENILIFMNQNADVAGANGAILKDGINSIGIEFEKAIEEIGKFALICEPDFSPIEDLVGLYGCNMVFRVDFIGDTRFDENLPLYAWQEDIDFAAQIKRKGRIVRTNAFFGVHQGIKLSRGSGLRLGYSQVSNPIYLIEKGTMPLLFGMNLMCKNIIINHLKSIRPESWIDRRGRMLGNWLAIKDMILGKLHPSRILDLN